MCDRIQCDAPPLFELLVEATGERIRLCIQCNDAYQIGEPISYYPKDDRRIS